MLANNFAVNLGLGVSAYICAVVDNGELFLFYRVELRCNGSWSVGFMEGGYDRQREDYKIERGCGQTHEISSILTTLSKFFPLISLSKSTP